MTPVNGPRRFGPWNSSTILERGLELRLRVLLPLRLRLHSRRTGEPGLRVRGCKASSPCRLDSTDQGKCSIKELNRNVYFPKSVLLTGR